ncbi:MAG: hypothetical protein J0J06_01420 [Sphingomonas sp.]|uniref:hypothetical protein n=1 Tax=Sphingomonas sp. TaxID=28214 RepID=UPI001AC98BD4|nr:hypothetical protein [Sphingomonas sp.]MBN8814089.1 hypothetical protein [Sphingomonas sp.]
MIAFALTAATTADPTDFDALSKAVAKCDRAVVTKTVTDTIARHSTFLIDAYAEQRAIAAARGDFAERRRKLHSGEKTGDTEAALTLAREALDDRQRALDDLRTLDRLEQDMMYYFRQQYLTQCAGRGTEK